ncbi:putative prefoldin subunit 3 [Tetrabaena socialis]|uniref:Prefoldin subunit 3 n=1 Tax=Tetrabaena socialis TaxID=47790 RepID=A0A2J7ZRP6_9CHLO|nr:putative prefoldin subunit 3 [Tetrabaena socialis]|eukprot:PNH02910.1 putative prefoldin subunit 3 [Tetrabaena socialis]
MSSEAADTAVAAPEGGVEVPKAEFIDDVAEFLKDKDTDRVLAQLQENMRTYRMVQEDLLQRRVRTLNKLPELKRAVEIVKQLIERQSTGEDTTADFMLAEGVYSKAKITDAKSVNLWLGADVMLEYPLEEARTLLEENEANCRANLKTNEESVSYIKDSMTTTEVAIARIYNFDVERRRKQKEAGGSS